MLTAKEIREKCEKDIRELQKICPHLETIWAEECWAPGHFTGKKIQMCTRCEKVIENQFCICKQPAIAGLLRNGKPFCVICNLPIK